MKLVVNTKEFKGHSYTFLGEDGKCPYTKKTEKEFIKEGYSVLNDDEFDALCKRFEDGLCGDWKEINEDDFEEMLNVLPPVGWYNGGFFMSERYTSNISGFYQEMNGKYYTSLQRMSTPRNEILDSLNKFISKQK